VFSVSSSSLAQDSIDFLAIAGNLLQNGGLSLLNVKQTSQLYRQLTQKYESIIHDSSYTLLQNNTFSQILFVIHDSLIARNYRLNNNPYLEFQYVIDKAAHLSHLNLRSQALLVLDNHRPNLPQELISLFNQWYCYIQAEEFIFSTNSVHSPELFDSLIAECKSDTNVVQTNILLSNNSQKNKQPDRSVKIYPNPSNSTFKFDITIETSALVDMNLYNASGQQVGKLLPNQRIQEGSFSMTFDGSNLPSGMYILRLTIDGEPKNYKLIIAK
jgi:hypothetical protein